MHAASKPSPYRTQVAYFGQGSASTKSLRAALRGPAEAGKPCDPETRQFKPTKKLTKGDRKKAAIAPGHPAGGKAAPLEAAIDPTGRKLGLFTKEGTPLRGRQKYHQSPPILRKRSEQNLKLVSSVRTADFQFAPKFVKSTSVEQSKQSLKHPSPDKILANGPFRRMQSSRQLCNNNLGQQPNQPKPLNEDYEINQLRIENEFMRSLYHRLCTAKENDRIKHAQAEQRQRKERERLEEEVKLLRSELLCVKQQRQVHIDHLFTHKLYDKANNRVAQCIREADSYLEQSQVHPLCDQKLCTEYFHSCEISPTIAHPTLRQEPTTRFQQGRPAKLPCQIKHQPDDSIQPSTQSASDSFSSLALESGGQSTTRP